MSIKLSLEKRDVAGKKLGSLRAAGNIPSVVFGAGDPIMTQSAYNPTEKALTEVGFHSPVELSIAGKSQLAIVKGVSRDPVSRRILNVEFQAISATEVVEATTPIKVVDFAESEAAKKHLVYLQVMEEIDIKAQPADLPDVITVSGKNLAEVDDRLTVADLELPKGVTIADKELSSSAAVANVYDPAAEAAAREAEDQKAAEAAAAGAAAGEGAPAEAAPADDSAAKAE